MSTVERAASSGWTLGDGLAMEPCRGDDVHRKWRPSQYRSCLSHVFEMEKIITSKTGNFDWMDCDMESISCLEKSPANVTTPNGKEDLQPFFCSSVLFLPVA